MKRFFAQNMKNKHSWQPDYVASDVFAIDYKMLFDQGIRAVAYDVDGTIAETGAIELAIEKATEMSNLLDKAGIKKRMLASNAERDLGKILEALRGFDIVQPHEHKPKPFREFYSQVIEVAGMPPEQIMMVGDRLVQDVFGAKRMGLKATLIALNPEHVSSFERRLLRHIWQPKLVARRAKDKN